MIGLWSGIAWLVGMTVFIAVLSEYVVDTIEVIDIKCFFFFQKMKSILTIINIDDKIVT